MVARHDKLVKHTISDTLDVIGAKGVMTQVIKSKWVEEGESLLSYIFCQRRSLLHLSKGKQRPK